MTAILESIRSAATPHGLNLIAATPADRYNAIVGAPYRTSAIAPDAKSVIVIANGGGALWNALGRHASANPGWWSREHPLDDFTRHIVERDIATAARRDGANVSVVYPFMTGSATLNFIELGKVAGLAGPSILGVVVHPVFGPWMAFRAALLIDRELDAPGDALGFDPCPTCTARSCIAVCPADAVAYPEGWNIPKCLTWRVEKEPDCAGGCHARIACVLGPEHRYSADELAHHQGRALRAMRPWYDAHIKPNRK